MIAIIPEGRSYAICSPPCVLSGERGRRAVPDEEFVHIWTPGPYYEGPMQRGRVYLVGCDVGSLHNRKNLKFAGRGYRELTRKIWEEAMPGLLRSRYEEIRSYEVVPLRLFLQYLGYKTYIAWDRREEGDHLGDDEAYQYKLESRYGLSPLDPQDEKKTFGARFMPSLLWTNTNKVVKL